MKVDLRARLGLTAPWRFIQRAFSPADEPSSSPRFRPCVRAPHHLRRAIWRLAWLSSLTLAAVVLAVALSGDSHKASADARLETLTTPEGTVIDVYTSRVSASDVYQTLLANGLQAHVGLARVDVVESGFTMSSVGGGSSTAGDGTVTYFASPATMQITADDFLAHPNYTVGHEYGHVWANYYKWTYWQGEWTAYLEARGLTGDPRLDSGGCWYVEEIIADDYRQLFAAPETTPGVIVAPCNKHIPAAEDVPGLLEFLAITWTHSQPPPGYGGDSATPTPTPMPTSTSTPIPTASPTPTQPSTPTPEPAATATPTATPTDTVTPVATARATATSTPVDTATPTPTPVATASPAATDTPTSVPTPTATVSPTPTATASSQTATVTLDPGWRSFVAPLTGTTDVTVYKDQKHKNNGGTRRVTQGNTYWAKGPGVITITAD